jgi:two-component system, sensor histidine kinase LadS
MKKYILINLLLFLLSVARAQPVTMEIYQLTDENKQLHIEQVFKKDSLFKMVNLHDLNFGIRVSNFWLKIVVTNTLPDATCKMVLSTITPDTIEIYQVNDGILKKELIGEGIPSKERFLNYYFKPVQNQTIIYLKITGNGQPIALPMSIIQCNMGDDIEISSILFSGLLYGIICFILIINLVLFINSAERLYLYFLLFNIFSTGVVLYFDGFVKLLLFPNSAYWNNEFVATALCGSFISTNYYFHEFLKIKENLPTFTPFFKMINLLVLGIGCLSFWHPTGFTLYIKINLLITTAEAILLFTSVVMVRHKEKEYFPIQLISIILVIVFGTIGQLYFFGLLPIHVITIENVHCMILPQILIQTFALAKRFTILTKERLELQTRLLQSSEQYSQSLISTLENERKRLSSEFHDSIGQNLLVIRNRILLMLKQNYTPIQKEKLESLASITSETLDEIRAISQNLRPTTLDTIGLTASVVHMMERLKRSTEIKIEFNCAESIDETIPKELEINVYRILQELTNNVLKHSKATLTTITILRETHHLSIQVKDNGIGFNPSKQAITYTGNGFSSIKERVKILKGGLNMVAEPQKGTIVDIKIPILTE